MFRSIATAALITLCVTAAAHAGETTVRFGDLNLASPADAQTLKTRVADAAQASCPLARLDFGVSSSKLYEAQREQKACVDRVAGATMARIQTIAAAAQASATRLARQ